MRIVIVGAGVVGYHLAQQLSAEGHDLSIVDKEAALLKRLSEKLDLLTVCGSADSVRVLEKAGIRGADLVVAVTNSDPLNMIVCAVAEELGVRRHLARVRNKEFAEERMAPLLTRLGIDRIISPDDLIVKALAERVELDGATEMADFAGGQAALRGFVVPEGAPLADRKLADIRPAYPDLPFLVVAIKRGERFFIPRGDDRIRAGDDIMALMDRDHLARFLPLVGRRMGHVRRVVIADANRLGLALAARLESDGVERVILIEEDEARAEGAADLLKSAMVLRGRATDHEAMADAKVPEADFYVALSGRDQDNLMSALLARSMGCKRTMVVMNDPEYLPLLEPIGIDASLNPRLMTVSTILQEVRRGGVLAAAKLGFRETEGLEIVVEEGSPITAGPLQDIGVPAGVIVGGVVFEGHYHLPAGDTVIRPGQTVIVFATPDAIGKAERLFSTRGR